MSPETEKSGKDPSFREQVEQETARAKRRLEAMKAEQAQAIKHTVAEGETLSHIAKKYYGDPSYEKYMAIYNANKDVIGDNPDIIVPGQVLTIPKLPGVKIL